MLPAALLVVVWLIWIPANGGYFPEAWYPSALGTIALLLVTMAASRRVLPTMRATRVALLAFAALVALGYLSMLWAGSPGSALQASNELLLYLAVGWVFSILPWTPGRMAVLLGVWSIGVLVFCGLALANVVSATHLDSFFFDQRYSDPLGYPNATAALALMGMWPALILSVRRQLPGWIRVPLLSAAVFLTEFSFLPESRGALVGLVATAVLVFVLSGNRLRLLASMAVVGVGLAITVPQILHLNRLLSDGRPVGSALSQAALGMLLTSIGALVIGVLMLFVERRVRPPAFTHRQRPSLGPRSRVAIALGAAVCLIVVGAVMAPAVKHEIHTVVQQGKSDASTGAVPLLSTSPEERTDYARVALHLFSGSPLLGVGTGNFGRRYDALRRFEKHSQYTHNLTLRALSENGIPGLALLATVVISLCVGLAKARKQLGALGRSCAVAAFAVATYYFVHVQFDWLDEYPVLAVPALAFALAAIELRRPARPGAESGGSQMGKRSRMVSVWPRSARRATQTAGLLAAGCVAGFALVPAYLATRYEDLAETGFRASPAAAYHDLSRAASLNPFSPDPFVSEGTIAIELGNFGVARKAFESANRRERDWYSYLELALLNSRTGRFTQASEQLRVAKSLDVDDPVLAAASDRVTHHERIDPARFNESLLQGVQAQLFSPPSVK